MLDGDENERRGEGGERKRRRERRKILLWERPHTRSALYSPLRLALKHGGLKTRRVTAIAKEDPEIEDVSDQESIDSTTKKNSTQINLINHEQVACGYQKLIEYSYNSHNYFS